MSGHDYFDMLNEVEQSQFRNNFELCRLTSDDSIEDYLEDNYDDFDTFISCAFLFEKANEGRAYWVEIRDSQRDGVDGSKRRNDPEKISKELAQLISMLAFIDITNREDEGSTLDDILSDLNIKLSDEK